MRQPTIDKDKMKKYLLYLWLAFVTPVLLGFLIIFLVAKGVFGKLPSFDELENPKSLQATEIFSADGVIIGKYFQENRTNVDYEEISPYVITALTSTEDERFQEHSGIDFKGLVRAMAFLGSKGGASTITQQLAKMLFTEEPSGNPIVRIKEKLQEWVIAAKLEKQYTKEEIVTMYLNKFDFINNAVGIKSASQVYFNTSPDSLTIEQAAMLVGMCKNPSLFNPIRRPDTTTHRRNVVLAQMYKNNQITELEFDSLKQLELGLDFKRVDHQEGLAPYFREVLRGKLKDIFSEKDPETEEYILHKPDGSPYDIYRDGLKVYTTIDSRMQAYAEAAVYQHLGKELQRDFHRELKKRGEKWPFDWRVSKEEVQGIIRSAMVRTQRYQVLSGKECANCHRRGKILEKITENGVEYFLCKAEDCGHKLPVLSEDSIIARFNKPIPMKVFSWKGERDTVMSVIDSIKYYKSFLQAGLMSMDPHTGFIKAWVGGIDYFHFKYDHVQQGKRQVGSTFKPFVYALAIQEGYSPCYEVPNIPVVFEQEKWGTQGDWSPSNSDDEYGGMVSLKYGLANSINTVTAWVLKQFGPKAPQQVVNLVRRMGITSHLDPVPSLCLGVADLSVYEITGANATFANKGVWNEPVYITRIEDKNGNVIKEFVPKTAEAMSEETAYAMLNLMSGVVDGVYNRHTEKKIGTGVRLRYKYKLRAPIAGKTGTTQNNSDGWFMGITPDLVTGVWVGAEDRAVRFSRTSFGQGANMSLPIWALYMQKVYANPKLKISQGEFEKPDKPMSIILDCDKYYKSQKADNFSDGEPDFSK